MSSTPTVLLTGATGTMGRFALEELLRADVHVRALVMPKDRARPVVERMQTLGPLEVMAGDLTDYASVRDAVQGCDFVVHIAALVSPAADENPELADKINVGSMQNLLRALEDQGQLEQTRVIAIGSVAETGNRPPPIHWGRVGDPLVPSMFDRYACSKIRAERLLVDSQVRRWVWLRQTAIAYPELVTRMGSLDPIAFHQPLGNCLEWVTARDSGRLIRQAVCRELPLEFWNRVYNIGGGERFRCTAMELMRGVFEACDLGELSDWFEPHWFATQNFHGHWYLDSDELEKWLLFRSEGLPEFLAQVSREVPKWRRWVTPWLPRIARKRMMAKVAMKRRGTLSWIHGKQTEELTAFYGSPDGWRYSVSWDDPRFQRSEAEPVRLDHGYDEAKSRLDRDDFAAAAEFRGGALLSEEVEPGNLRTRLKWRCALGHELTASPYLVLKAGHWCPSCEPPPWNVEVLAARNRFFAQVAKRRAIDFESASAS